MVIAHSIDVDDTRSCNSITINAGARLDVEAALTVANTSTMAAGSTLKVKAGGTYTQSAGNFTVTNGTIDILKGQDMVFSNSSTTLTNAGGNIIIRSDSNEYGALVLDGTYTATSGGSVEYRRWLAGTSTW